LVTLYGVLPYLWNEAAGEGKEGMKSLLRCGKGDHEEWKTVEPL
jgi:hypothetical protein